MIINLETRKETKEWPGGVVGQISFARLIKALRETGEFKRDERVTHLKIDVPGGVIMYRVEEDR